MLWKKGVMLFKNPLKEMVLGKFFPLISYLYRNSVTFLTAIDKNSPKPAKGKKLNNSTIYQELDELVENDEEVRKHKLEIERLKQEQKRQLEKYMQKEIGKRGIYKDDH